MPCYFYDGRESVLKILKLRDVIYRLPCIRNGLFYVLYLCNSKSDYVNNKYVTPNISTSKTLDGRTQSHPGLIDVPYLVPPSPSNECLIKRVLKTT